jgi:hypothetical protein
VVRREMGYLVESFEDLKYHWMSTPSEIRPSYLVTKKGKKTIVTVICGKFLWTGEFTKEVKTWLKEVNALKIVKAVPTELYLMGLSEGGTKVD